MKTIFFTSISLLIVFIHNIDFIGWVYDSDRFAQIIILSVALSACALIPSVFPSFSIKLKFSFCAIVALGLLSSLLAVKKEFALLELGLFTALLVLTFLLAFLSRKAPDKSLKLTILALSASVVTYLIGVLAGYSAGLFEQVPLRWNDLFHSYSNVRFFNQFQIWTLPLITAGYLYFSDEKPHASRVIAVIAVFWWMTLFLSSGRGATIAISLALLVSLFVYRKLAYRFVAVTLLFAISGLLLYWIMFSLMPAWLSLPDTVMSELIRVKQESRLILWKDALEMIKANPVLGVGPMHYAYYPNPIAAHPHNSLLQWAAEWGVVSLVLVLVIVFYGVRAWIQAAGYHASQHQSREAQLGNVALFTSLMAGVTYSMVSGVIVMPHSQLMMCLIIGLMIGRCHIKRDIQKNGTIARYESHFIRLLAIVTLIIMWWTVWPSLSERLEAGVFNVDMTNIETRGPRFWQVGGVPHD